LIRKIVFLGGSMACGTAMRRFHDRLLISFASPSAIGLQLVLAKPALYRVVIVKIAEEAAHGFGLGLQVGADRPEYLFSGMSFRDGAAGLMPGAPALIHSLSRATSVLAGRFAFVLGGMGLSLETRRV